MKLVVCYGHGSEGSGYWTENLCVEYESKDHFLVAFIDAFAVWAEQKKQHYKLQRDLANARASQDQKKIDAVWQKWHQYCNDSQCGADWRGLHLNQQNHSSCTCS